MSVLCDRIEQFIVNMLEEREGQAELKRSEVAARFGCAPSQVTYVLTTRFCPLRGYLVQARRGGGGYTRIVRVKNDRSGCIAQLVHTELMHPLSERRAAEIVRNLRHADVVSAEQADIMLAAISAQSLRAAEDAQDTVRSSVLRAMLLRCM